VARLPKENAELAMSRSWFYKWKDHALAPRAARKEALAAEVRRLFKAHRGTYGSPRITADLHQAGWKVHHLREPVDPFPASRREA
jgi:hypothetical protein